MIVQHGTINNIKSGVDAEGREWGQFNLQCKETTSKEYFFINCYCFNYTARYIINYIKSGDVVIVTGQLEPNKIQDNEKETHTFKIKAIQVDKVIQREKMNDKINIK